MLAETGALPKTAPSLLSVAGMRNKLAKHVAIIERTIHNNINSNMFYKLGQLKYKKTHASVKYFISIAFLRWYAKFDGIAFR